MHVVDTLAASFLPKRRTNHLTRRLVRPVLVDDVDNLARFGLDQNGAPLDDDVAVLDVWYVELVQFHGVR